jgi:enterochelin esterase family protein
MMPPGDTPPEAVADPKGTVTNVAMIHSDVYGYDYSYQLYIPAEYQAGKPAALMIFQDGGNYMFTFRSPSVFDSLIASGEMPVTISAYINPGAGNERSVEYDATTPKYATFLINEFIPNAIANAYDIVDDPNGWAIGGHSSGGSCAFTAGWNFPDKFHKIMTHSGSFLDLASDDNPADPGAGAYVDLLTSTMPIKPLRVTLLSSPNDLGNGKWFQANNDMAMALQTAGYPFRYMKGMGTHDPRPWDTYDYPDALRWLWRGYTLPQYAP